VSYLKEHAKKRNWEKETSSSSSGILVTNLFFTSSCCSTSNRLFRPLLLAFTLFLREHDFTAIAVRLVQHNSVLCDVCNVSFCDKITIMIKTISLLGLCGQYRNCVYLVTGANLFCRNYC
jgi:hypothetical protein